MPKSIDRQTDKQRERDRQKDGEKWSKAEVGNDRGKLQSCVRG